MALLEFHRVIHCKSLKNLRQVEFLSIINKNFDNKELEVDIMDDDRSFADKIKKGIEQLEKYRNISSVQ